MTRPSATSNEATVMTAPACWATRPGTPLTDRSRSSSPGALSAMATMYWAMRAPPSIGRRTVPPSGRRGRCHAPDRLLALPFAPARLARVRLPCPRLGPGRARHRAHTVGPSPPGRPDVRTERAGAGAALKSDTGAYRDQLGPVWRSDPACRHRNLMRATQVEFVESVMILPDCRG